MNTNYLQVEQTRLVSKVITEKYDSDGNLFERVIIETYEGTYPTTPFVRNTNYRTVTL